MKIPMVTNEEAAEIERKAVNMDLHVETGAYTWVWDASSKTIFVYESAERPPKRVITEGEPLYGALCEMMFYLHAGYERGL